MDRGTVRKHVEFYSKNKNKFEKLVHLVVVYKNLSRCTVTWTPNWNNILTKQRTSKTTVESTL